MQKIDLDARLRELVNGPDTVLVEAGERVYEVTKRLLSPGELMDRALPKIAIKGVDVVRGMRGNRMGVYRITDYIRGPRALGDYLFGDIRIAARRIAGHNELHSCFEITVEARSFVGRKQSEVIYRDSRDVTAGTAHEAVDLMVQIRWMRSAVTAAKRQLRNHGVIPFYPTVVACDHE